MSKANMLISYLSRSYKQRVDDFAKLAPKGHLGLQRVATVIAQIIANLEEPRDVLLANELYDIRRRLRDLEKGSRNE